MALLSANFQLTKAISTCGIQTDYAAVDLFNHICEVHALMFMDNPVAPAFPILLSGDLNGNICVWDAKNIIRVAAWKAHDGSITSFHVGCVTSGATELISFWSHGRDGYARLWELPLRELHWDGAGKSGGMSMPTSVEGDQRASFESVCKVPIGGLSLCPVHAKSIDGCDKSAHTIFAGVSALHPEKIDILLADASACRTLAHFQLQDSVVAAADTEDVIFTSDTLSREAQQMLRSKTGMLTAVQILGLSPIARSINGANIHKPRHVAVSTAEAPAVDDESIGRALLRYARERGGDGGPESVSRIADNYDTTIALLAGFENGRVYLLHVDVNMSTTDAPPSEKVRVAGVAVIGLEAVLRISVDCKNFCGLAVTATEQYAHLATDAHFHSIRVIRRLKLPSRGSSACLAAHCAWETLTTIAPADSSDVAYDDDDLTLGVVACWDNTVRVMSIPLDGDTSETSKDSDIAVLRRHDSAVYSVAMWQTPPDVSLMRHTYVASGEKQGKIVLWQL